MRYRRVGCGLGVMRRSACLAVGPIVVDGFAALFGCVPVLLSFIYTLFNFPQDSVLTF